jgi:DNA-binding MarR family transcriptional regulator
MRTECRVSARVLGFALPCPGLLPSPAITPLQPPDCGTPRGCVAPGRLFDFDDGFVAPPGYHGVGGLPDGHVVIVAVRAATVSPGSWQALLFCLHRPVLRNLTIGGDRVTVVACPEGSYETGGHVLARWVHDGVMVGVSVHGINATNIDLDLAMARHVTWISPQSMGTTLAALEARGLVARRPDPGDGRRAVMSVTEAGRQVLQDKRAARTQQLAQALSAGFTPAELGHLMVAAPLLERLAQSL